MRRTLLSGTFVVVISLAVVAAGFLRPSATQKSADNQADNSLTQFASYRQWTLVNPMPVVMDPRTAMLCGRLTSPSDNPNPHSTRYISVYVNQLGHESMMTRLNPAFPQGSIIVKEKLNSPYAKNPELLTAMIKREKGYNPESGDWEYFVLDGSASTIKAQGKIEKCQTCHVDSKDTDYVDRSYLPKEIREKLQ